MADNIAEVPVPQVESNPAPITQQKPENLKTPITQRARELGRRIWIRMRNPKSNPDATLQEVADFPLQDKVGDGTAQAIGAEATMIPRSAKETYTRI